jgi:hypothetical protein
MKQGLYKSWHRRKTQVTLAARAREYGHYKEEVQRGRSWDLKCISFLHIRPQSAAGEEKSNPGS